MMFQRLREWWWKRRGYVRVDSRASLYPLWTWASLKDKDTNEQPTKRRRRR